jgi:hypothetical protein
MLSGSLGPQANVPETNEPLYRATTLNNADQNHDDRDNQKNVNDPAQGIRGSQTEQPQNEQNYGKRPQ